MTQGAAGWAVVIFGIFIIGVIVIATVEKASYSVTSGLSEFEDQTKEIQIKHLKRVMKYLEEVRNAGHPHTVEQMQRKLEKIDRECGEELRRRGLK